MCGEINRRREPGLTLSSGYNECRSWIVLVECMVSAEARMVSVKRRRCLSSEVEVQGQTVRMSQFEDEIRRRQCAEGAKEHANRRTRNGELPSWQVRIRLLHHIVLYYSTARMKITSESLNIANHPDIYRLDHQMPYRESSVPQRDR